LKYQVNEENEDVQTTCTFIAFNCVKPNAQSRISQRSYASTVREEKQLNHSHPRTCSYEKLVLIGIIEKDSGTHDSNQINNCFSKVKDPSERTPFPSLSSTLHSSNGETSRECFSNFTLHGGNFLQRHAHLVPTEKSQSNDIGTDLEKQGSTLSSMIKGIPSWVLQGPSALEGLSDAEKKDVLNQALKILPNFHALKSPMFIKDWKRTIFSTIQ
jgi:hypothetical protein